MQGERLPVGSLDPSLARPSDAPGSTRAHRRHRLDRHRPPDDLPGPVHRLAGRRPAGQGLAVLPRRGPRRPPRRGRRQHRVRDGLPRAAPGARRGRRPGLRRLPVLAASATASTPTRCTCPSSSTPRGSCAPPTADHNQIASFYAGAMREARDIELGPVADRIGGLDLVLIGANDPEAMLRHTEECRTARLPVRSPTRPSRSPGWTAPGSASSIDGATYLFTNEYEAALAEQKTGWSAEEILDRVGDPGRPRSAPRASGSSARASRRCTSSARPRSARSTRPVWATRFRAGFLAGLAWGLPLRALRPGRQPARDLRHRDRRHPGVRAGPGSASSSGSAAAYGPDAVADVAPHVRCPAPLTLARAPAGRAAAVGLRVRRRRCVPSRRGAARRRRRPRAGHPPGGLPGRRSSRCRCPARGPVGWWSPGPARRPAARRTCGSAGRCARPAAGSRSGSTRRTTRWCAAAPTRAGRAAGSGKRRRARPTAGCTTSGWVHSVEAWSVGPDGGSGSPAACTASPSAACSRGSRCSTASATRRRSPWWGWSSCSAPTGRDRLLDVQWATSTWFAWAPSRSARPATSPCSAEAVPLASAGVGLELAVLPA